MCSWLAIHQCINTHVLYHQIIGKSGTLLAKVKSSLSFCLLLLLRLEFHRICLQVQGKRILICISFSLSLASQWSEKNVNVHSSCRLAQLLLTWRSLSGSFSVTMLSFEDRIARLERERRRNSSSIIDLWKNDQLEGTKRASLSTWRLRRRRRRDHIYLVGSSTSNFLPTVLHRNQLIPYVDRDEREISLQSIVTSWKRRTISFSYWMSRLFSRCKRAIWSVLITIGKMFE